LTAGDGQELVHLGAHLAFADRDPGAGQILGDLRRTSSSPGCSKSDFTTALA